MFLAGRSQAPMETVAADIRAAGGSAEVAVLDATDEQAVDDVAAFLASDRASGMTATMANVTCGLVPG